MFVAKHAVRLSPPTTRDPLRYATPGPVGLGQTISSVRRDIPTKHFATTRLNIKIYCEQKNTITHDIYILPALVDSDIHLVLLVFCV